MMRGSCLCSSVRYEIDGSFEEAHHCHCSMCRKSHGAAFATYGCARTKNFRLITGHGELKNYRSSSQVRRSFCTECGSTLFFEHDAAPKLVFVAVGTLDEATEGSVNPDAHVFASSKAAWWTIADALPRHDGQRPEYGG